LQTRPYPITAEALRDEGWGEPRVPQGAPPRQAIPEHWIVSDYVFSGGGHGDPLDRDPARVARDLRIELISPRAAEVVYGVVVDPQTGAADAEATRQRREAVRAERLRTSDAPPAGVGAAAEQDWQPVLRFHEYLDLVRAADAYAIRCRQCRQVLCDGAANYKAHARRRTLDLEQFSVKRLPSGQDYRAVLHEYFCPGCATLLCVDVYCPELGADEPLWDTRFELAQFAAEPAR
jgi:N-methylhydantoinase B